MFIGNMADIIFTVAQTTDLSCKAFFLSAGANLFITNIFFGVITGIAQPFEPVMPWQDACAIHAAGADGIKAGIDMKG